MSAALNEASSTSSFLRELTQHASASDRRAEMGVRTASSVSVGEVQSRTHTEVESEDHFESASRQFANPNKCHAVTYFFYQINKTQVVKFSIVAIQRRVIDPAANTRITNNPFRSDGDVSVIPSAVLATDASRLKVEEIGRASVAAKQQANLAVAAGALSPNAFLVQPALLQFPALEPIPAELKAKALQQVDADLVKEGLLDQSGAVSKEEVAKFSFERRSSLPTPGLLVKGCLDECNTCEEALDKEIELDLDRKKLENELLKKQIELLEKSQEYRCCPAPEPVNP